MGNKLTVEIESFKPLKSNTLHGFCDIVVPELHLRIHDITIHEKNGKRWIGLPAKPQLTREGVARRDERDKILYTPVLEFSDAATRTAFSARVIAALMEFEPGAFDGEEAA